MNVLFVGQAPGRRAPRTARAFGGPGAGSRLAKLCGLTHGEFLSRCRTANLIKGWPGKNGKGDAFPFAVARRGLHRIIKTDLWRDADRIVFVGQGVARVVLPNISTVMVKRPCEWYFSRFAYLPHPSGVNRWYNDRSNTRRAETFLRALVKEAH